MAQEYMYVDGIQVFDYIGAALMVARRDAQQAHDMLPHAAIAYSTDLNERRVFYPGRSYDVAERWCPECQDWRDSDLIDDGATVCRDCLERREEARIAALLTPEGERRVA